MIPKLFRFDKTTSTSIPRARSENSRNGRSDGADLLEATGDFLAFNTPSSLTQHSRALSGTRHQHPSMR